MLIVGLSRRVLIPTLRNTNMAKCGQPCEIWSRVSGYHRPVRLFNQGKREEFKDRKVFEMGASLKEAA